MVRIQQEHVYGCVIAALAMVMGKSYQEVHDDIQDHTGHFEESVWVKGNDFSKQGVSLDFDASIYLAHRGYAVQYMWRSDRGTNKPREVWPIYWVKEHPTFCGYLVSVLSNQAHAVAMELDGTVLDPWREGKYTLADYQAVHSMIAVFKVQP